MPPTVSNELHGREPPRVEAPAGETTDDVHDRVAGFLDALYAAMLEPDRLADALQALARLFKADDAAIYLARSGARGGGQLLFSGAAGAKTDEAPGTPSRTARGQLVAVLDANGRLGHADVARGQVDIAGEEGGAIHYMTLPATLRDQRALALVALSSHKAFGEEERRLAAALLADVERAFNLHLTHAARLSSSLDNQLFEASTIALLLTSQKTVERANPRARSLLEVKSPIKTVGRLLRFEDARAQLAFDTLSDPYAGESAPAATVTFASVVAGQDGATWLAQLARLKRKSESPLLAAAVLPRAVLVALTQFNAASASRQLPLDGFTELSAIERTILSAIVDGRDIAEISAGMQRSSETVRWHVKRMFTKLGVDSQVDLARLGSLLLPISN